MNRHRALLVVLVLVLLGLQWRLWTGKGSYAEVAQLEQRAERSRAENRRLLEHNAILEADVLSLKKAPENLEARARSELGMIREGETFFMIVPGGPTATTP